MEQLPSLARVCKQFVRLLEGGKAGEAKCYFLSTRSTKAEAARCGPRPYDGPGPIVATCGQGRAWQGRAGQGTPLKRLTKIVRRPAPYPVAPCKRFECWWLGEPGGSEGAWQAGILPHVVRSTRHARRPQGRIFRHEGAFSLSPLYCS